MTCPFYMHVDRHARMLNITSRIACRVRYLPNWEFDWSDTAPQRNRDSLGAVDFMMSEDDATVITERATQYMMKFLVQEFSTFSDLKRFLPDETPLHPVTKSEVVPMKVLFRDEKYVSETIEILMDLAKNAKLTGHSQVCHSNKIGYVHSYEHLCYIAIL